MGTVLIHAGMPKTGSTSVQEWLRRNAPALREHHGLTVVRDRGGPFDEALGLEAHNAGPFVISNRFLISYYGGVKTGTDPDTLQALCDEFTDELDEAATIHGDIVITAEGFAQPLVEHRVDFLTALERLSRRHRVRFMYYVRPQHETLESRWRQWGYHQGQTPSVWVEGQLDDLDYGRQLAEAEKTAPSVRFEVRPFRLDLLDGNDVVTDFARQVIGAPELSGEEITANPGLSLDLAILLHGAPDVVTETPEHLRVGGVENGRRQATLAAVTARWNAPVSDQARRARQALHAIAHGRFAADNAMLTERHGWATDSFVPTTTETADLADLDGLLTPSVDPTALAHLHHAIADLCAAHEERNSA